MAEPFASGVLNTLLQPRASQMAALARVARKTTQSPALSTTFFTPARRQGKERAHAPCAAAGPVGQHMLACQAWACPASKQEVWSHDGSMRTTLMGEIAPPATRGRVRRTSKTSRDRFRQPLVPEAARQYHVSSPHSGARLARQAGRGAKGSYTPLEDEDDVEEEASVSATLPPEAPMNPAYPTKDKELLDGRTFTRLMETTDYFREMPADRLLDVAEMVADHIDGLCRDFDPRFPGGVDLLAWGRRILYLMELSEAEPSTSASPRYRDRIQTLVARGQAYIGNVVAAEQYLYEHADNQQSRRISSQQYFRQSPFHRVLSSVVLAYHANEDTESAITFLFEASYPRWSACEGVFLVDFRLSGVLRSLDLRRLQRFTADWDSRKREELLNFLLAANNGLGDFENAHRFVAGLYNVTTFPSSLLVQSIKGLMKLPTPRKTEMARALFSQLSSDTPGYNDMDQLFKKKPPDASYAQSVIEEARATFADIPFSSPQRTPAESHIRSPLAVMTLSEFEATYPLNAEGLREPRPPPRAYRRVIEHLCQTNSHGGVVALWEDIKKQGVELDARLCASILDSYKATYDSKRAVELLDYMHERRVCPSNEFYTQLIRFFVNRLDIWAIEGTYRDALKHIKPNIELYTVVVNGYLKCGAWKRAFKMFSSVRELITDDSPALYNAILKGCLYLGAPFETVMKLFAQLERQGTRPNKYTYTILMNHAMEGKHWAFAQSFYQDLLRMDEGQPAYKRVVDITLMTTMIRGYLDSRRVKDAKDMVKEMSRLGIPHSSITHAAIVRMYVAMGQEDDVLIAEEYINGVVAEGSWRKIDLGAIRSNPLSLMFTPIVAAYAKRGDVASAERVLGNFLEAGGEPTISILRNLLKAYSTDPDRLEDFCSVWENIVELAMESQKRGRSVQTSLRPACAPLDIYTRVMSLGGHHSELARMWGRLYDMGFAFDCSNWNAYALACLRAGEITRAFEVLERILQPNFNVGLRNHFAPLPSETADIATKTAALRDLPTGPPPRPMLRSHHRYVGSRVNRDTNRGRVEFTDARAISEDFSYPLRALSKLGPAWMEWRPIPELLRSMLVAVLLLEDGFPLRPLRPGETRPFAVAHEETEQRNVTEKLLASLFKTYPRTAHRLSMFRQVERRLLGPTTFRQKYIWSR